MIVRQQQAEQTHTVEIPSEFYRRLESLGAKQGMTAEEFVLQAVYIAIDDAAGNGAPPSTTEMTDAPVVERTVDEVTRLFEGEWILMKVTGLDDRHNPEKGIVLAHSNRRGDISDALAREPSREEQLAAGLHQPYYIFRAFPSIAPGPESDRAILEMVAVLSAQRAITVTISGQVTARD